MTFCGLLKYSENDNMRHLIKPWMNYFTSLLIINNYVQWSVDWLVGYATKLYTQIRRSSGLGLTTSLNMKNKKSQDVCSPLDRLGSPLKGNIHYGQGEG